MATARGVPPGVSAGEAMRCAGYIVGMNGGVRLESVARADLDPILYCLPDGVAPEQQMRVALKWLRDHPEDLHLAASTSFALAFRSAFPCK